MFLNIGKLRTNTIRQVEAMHNYNCIFAAVLHVSQGGKAYPWIDKSRLQTYVTYPPVGGRKTTSFDLGARMGYSTGKSSGGQADG